MARSVNRQILLKSRPAGRITPDNFELVERPVPRAGDGQAVARVLYVSLDPTNRIWISDAESYLPPVGIGEVMRGGGLAQIVESKNPAYQVGDIVVGLTGWQDYCVADGTPGLAGLMPVPKGLPIPLPAFMGALGVTGLTAFFGLLEIGKPTPGETVVISAAAGATGSVVGQIARIKGCRAVGIAGGKTKCDWLVNDLGFDAAVDYKAAGFAEKLAAACPKGIDVDFENVGGPIMETVLAHMNLRGRVVLCGLISGYNSGEPMRGPYDAILVKRLKVEGFIVLDFVDRFAEGAMQLAQWMMEGKLKHRDTIVEGLEQAPVAVNMLFDGENVGKLLVKVAEPA
jgi:hypothetical protein